MSCSKWAYRESCNGKPCCGDCDKCRYADEPWCDEEWEENE